MTAIPIGVRRGAELYLLGTMDVDIPDGASRVSFPLPIDLASTPDERPLEAASHLVADVVRQPSGELVLVFHPSAPLEKLPQLRGSATFRALVQTAREVLGVRPEVPLADALPEDRPRPSLPSAPRESRNVCSRSYVPKWAKPLR